MGPQPCGSLATPQATNGSGLSSGVADTRRLPKYIHWGEAADSAIPRAMAKLGCRRALLVVSTSLRKSTEVIDRIQAALGERCVGVWDGMPPHTPREAVLDVATAARDAGADVIVTIGGGSLTDGAKAARVALAEGIVGIDDFDGLHSKPNSKLLPVKQICAPTTLSSGEYAPFAGVTDTNRRFKDAYVYFDALPGAVILDPALTARTPLALLLSTGIRAVDHCVEGLCSLHGNPLSDSTAQAALAFLVRGLRGVRANPNDLDAHLECQLGTWKACEAMAQGPKMGASHAIGHCMGGVFDVPHGETSCVALAAVLEWNSRDAPARVLSRQALVVRAFELAGVDEVQPKPGRRVYVSRAAAMVAGFVEELGMPRTMGEVGLRREDMPLLAEKTMGDRLVDSNPRPIKSKEDVAEILELAL